MYMGPIFQPAGANLMQPAAKEEEKEEKDEGPRKRRSIFVPEHKMRFNIVAMILAVFIPWGMFVMLSGTASFCMIYTRPMRAYAAYALAVALCIVLIIIAFRARREEPDPTWYTYLAIVTSLFSIAAVLSGDQTCRENVKPWLQLNSLGYRRGVDASKVPGQNYMDVGIIEFNAGNDIDPDRTYHFKNGALYCVAPIVTNQTAPETQSYDFWVVGKDCCSMGSSDFRCGSWFGPGKKSGLRVLSDEDLMYYRLAVQQAEGTYNIMAKHPIFLTWSMDPTKALSIWNRRTFRNYLFGNGVAFVTAVFVMCMASARFAFIGRGPWSRPWWETRFEQQMAMQGMMGGMGMGGMGYGGMGYGGMGYGGMGMGYGGMGGAFVP